MEAIEELEFMDNNDATTVTHIAKGKRTKRQRPFSPCAVVAAAVAAGITTSSSSSTTVSGDHAAATDYGSISSATTTNYESTEEEEDMANCLILLAQGGDHHTARNNTTAIAIAKQRQSDSDIQSLAQSERGGRRRFAEMAAATTAAARIGFYVYECKTCNRTFPSFQALGGHRASHKKPKLVVVEEKKPPPPPPVPPVSSQIIHNFEIEEAQLKSGAQISLQLGSNNNKAAKIHECSICGSEFTSGQALGGHMRRHRASTSTSSTTTTNSTPPPLNQNGAAVEMKPRNILALDLNLPAPEEDLRDSKFQFTPKQKALVMSAPSLVGCHY